MKKFFSICALSIFAFVIVFAEEGQVAVLKWQMRVPKNTSVIRYQLNGEDADNWNIVHNTADGVLEISVDTPVGQDSVIYVQQSKDGVLWSESNEKLITADVVQRIYNKNHGIVDESSERREDSIVSPLPSTVSPDVRDVVALSPKTSAFAFSFLVKPQVNVNLQKAILVAKTGKWNTWKGEKKLEAKDLAPRLDFEFGFQNIGGKKGDVAAFDIALNLGYEAAPYEGWNGNPFDNTFMDLQKWYHKTSLDVRLNLAFNSGVFRPYIGVGAGVMFTFSNATTCDNLLGEELFTLKESTGNSLVVKGFTYVLGALGFRFNCSSNFTIGIEGTYKLFVTGADKDHIWHAVDCGIALGGTWSI